MSAHTKARRIRIRSYAVIYKRTGKKSIQYKIPDSLSEEFEKWLEEHNLVKDNSSSDDKYRSPWEECISWEEIAANRIAKYTKVGLALRGARYRENLSQKQLAMLCGISQNNLSKMENGKRPIGPKVAEKLSKVLGIDVGLLLDS